MKTIKTLSISILLVAAYASSTAVRAEVDWMSFTMDNDSFVGNDNGYTNGMTLAWWDIPEDTDRGQGPEPGFLASLMTWSLPDRADAFVVDIGVVGQVMITPDDIEEDPPILPPDDLPYGGLLYYSDIFVHIYDQHADTVSVTLGVVGEYSFAEQTQEFVHDLIGSDEPCCWDSQLSDEVVWQVTRSRVWRTWVSDNGHTDFLTSGDLALGSIASSVGVGAMIRHGRDMKRSFATVPLMQGRTTNPIATDGSWYVFAGGRAGYLANQIFLDGSRTYDKDDYDEVDYESDTLAVIAGIAYSWKDISFTFAFGDLNTNEVSDNDAAKDYSEYGTFTIAWRLE